MARDSVPAGLSAARLIALVGIVLTLSASCLMASDKVYYGLLHAHTSYSDGVGTPAEAFAAAKAAGLDFFAVTPHNHVKAENSWSGENKDGLMIGTNNDLYNATTPITVVRKWTDENGDHNDTITVSSLFTAANEATDTGFIAIVGQEFSTISSGNHVNVFEFPSVLTADNGDFYGLFEELTNATPANSGAYVVQLNHPNAQQDLFYNGSNSATLRKMYNDYGIDEADYGPEFSQLVAATDNYVHLIEVLTGPAKKEENQTNYHYRGSHLKEHDYYFYLIQGFHIGPSAGQDNHFRTWGSVTDARTGVYAPSRTKSNILQAFRSHKTFVTEDKNLALFLSVNNSPMGSNSDLSAGSALTLSVSVSDQDEPNSSYEVNLYYGDIQPANSESATYWKATDGLQETLDHDGDGTLTISGYESSGEPEFFYVRVEQADGDRAWSAPVWLNHPEGSGASAGARYVWTKTSSSQVYHYLDCRTASNISPENQVTGFDPPPGRRLHNCNRIGGSDNE